MIDVQFLQKSCNLIYKKPCTKSRKHDIMHSANSKTMCSANEDFAMQIYQKGLCGKAFWQKLSTPKLWLKQLMRRNDGTYTPNSLRLCASLDAWCFAPYCATRNARGAIFLGSLASQLAASLCVDYPEQVTTRRF